MAKNKAEKEQARARRKKEARKRDEARRAVARSTRDAVLSILTGSATATELARVFNDGLRPPAAHAGDEHLHGQLSELRIEVDKYLYAMHSAIESSSRRESLLPGVLFCIVASNDSPSELPDEEISCEPMPLALSCRGSLTFEPIDDHFQRNPHTSIATWVVSTNFDPVVGGMLVLALSGNCEGARSIHVIHEGKWASLHGFANVDRFFVKTLKELVEEEHPDAVLLATAVRLDSIVREKRSLEEAVEELRETPEAELWQRLKPYLEKLRFSQFGYHDDLMGLVEVIAGIRETWGQDVERLKETAQAIEDFAETQRKRADTAEKALASAQREAKRQEALQPLTPAPPMPMPAAGAAPPLRERLADLFR